MKWVSAPSLPATVWAWAVVQIPLFHRRRRLPPWLSVFNPVLDITAVSCIIGGYALASTPMLALRCPPG